MKARKLARKLADRIGAGELAERTGYSERAIESALRGGKISARLRAELEGAFERSERSRKAARTRARHQTRLDLPIEKASIVAEAEGVTERTARRWIEDGGAPRSALDTARQITQGYEPYRAPAGGKREAITSEERARLERTMVRFVEAVRGREGKDEIARAYRAFRRAKVPVRRSVTRKAWRDFIDRMGEDLDLPDTGLFSKERFRKS